MFEELFVARVNSGIVHCLKNSPPFYGVERFIIVNKAEITSKISVRKQFDFSKIKA